MHKLSTGEFISNAVAVHGDRYDYCQVNYQGGETKVSILCREHGLFSTLPGNHMQGRGCPLCANRQRAASKTKTTEQFIREASLVHKGRYDYSKAIYKGKVNELSIICHEHGEFRQKACVHLRGHGCQKCGLDSISEKKRHTLAGFVAKARGVHGNRYDYSLVDYQGSHQRVTIVCPLHGLFQQTAADHIYNGSGCPACVGLERYCADEFIRRAREMHGDKYDYSGVAYVNAKSKVEIICPKHGSFQQPPHHHIKGIGCPKCKADKISEAQCLTNEEFIERAHAMHGGRYDYSQVSYEKGRSKITVICPKHGAFDIEARVHIHQRTGCPECSEGGFNVRKPSLLYYLRVIAPNGDSLYKIGITNRTVDERFSLADLSRIIPVRIWEYVVGQDALNRETEILRTYKHLSYQGDPVLQSGNSELFTSDVLNLDSHLELSRVSRPRFNP